jgi:hypothetical protein
VSKFPQVGRRHIASKHMPRGNDFHKTGRRHSEAKPQRSEMSAAVGAGQHVGSGTKIPGQPVERSNWRIGRTHVVAPKQRRAVHLAVGRPLRNPVALELKLAVSNAVELDRATSQHDVAQHHIMAGMRETGAAHKPKRGLPR